MDAERVNLYKACDSAIKAMNREIVDAFGKLKLTKWKDASIIREVKGVYRKSARRARKRYYEVAFEAYVLAMMLCGEDAGKAHSRAEQAITNEWIDTVLEVPDAVTKYAFNPETDRKMYRLAEALEVVPDRNKEIDRAERDWSRQLGQYAIIFTDESMLQAYRDFGIKRIVWYTEDDEKTCHSCIAYHGREYPIDNVPEKPHYGCRCRMLPVIEISDG